MTSKWQVVSIHVCSYSVVYPSQQMITKGVVDGLEYGLSAQFLMRIACHALSKKSLFTFTLQLYCSSTCTVTITVTNDLLIVFLIQVQTEVFHTPSLT